MNRSSVLSLRRRLCSRCRQAGFTLLETLIALGIGLFLLGGIALVMGLTRQNFNAQSGLSQLQDDQRIAVSMLVMVVEHAGFFPDPAAQTVADAFPAIGAFGSGQSLTGTVGSAGAGDTLSVRFQQSPPGNAGSDFMLDCQGVSNTDAINRDALNVFGLNAAGELTCSVNGNTAQPLAAGLSGFSVLYGVDSDNDSSVDQYLPATSMTPQLWLATGSVKVSLSFVNPLDATKPITVVRVINLMNHS